MGDYPHKMNWEQQQSKFSKSKWKSHWVGETSLGIWTRAHLYRQRGLGSYHSSSAWAIFDLEEVTSQLIFSCFLTWEQPSFHFIVWRIEWGTTPELAPVHLDTCFLPFSHWNLCPASFFSSTYVKLALF